MVLLVLVHIVSQAWNNMMHVVDAVLKRSGFAIIELNKFKITNYLTI